MEEVSTRPNTMNLVVSILEDNLKIILPTFKENYLITKKYLDFNYFREVSYLMNNKEHLTEQDYNKILLIKALKKIYIINKLLCIVLNITENRVNCMKFLNQLGVRQYATKYKSINYYT